MAPLFFRNPSRLSLCPSGNPTYSRSERLAGLIGLWPHELEDYSHPGTSRIVALLRKALRAERNRGKSGHWAYDLNRHQALSTALKAERTRLTILERGLPSRKAACADQGLARPAGTLRLPEAGRDVRRSGSAIARNRAQRSADQSNV
jgi:hypothetical protein